MYLRFFKHIYTNVRQAGNKGLKSTRQRKQSRKIFEQFSSHFKPITDKDLLVPSNAFKIIQNLKQFRNNIFFLSNPYHLYHPLLGVLYALWYGQIL
jgi:hypothetical protein